MTRASNWEPSRRLDHRIVRELIVVLARTAFRIWGRLRVVGLENLPRTGPVVLAGNHASYIDPVLVWAAMYRRRRAFGIAKDDLWQKRVIGYLIDAIGAVPVKRNAPDVGMLRAALGLLSSGHIVGIFPEGSRTTDGKLQPAHHGVAVLLQRSGAPVVPVAIIGTFEMWPRGTKRIRRVPLTVAFGSPIHFDADTSRAEITNRIMNAVAQLMTANGRPTEPPPTLAREEPEEGGAQARRTRRDVKLSPMETQTASES
jgi:1-acyl-sn-glycerol-3-phosphate acyltransferase